MGMGMGTNTGMNNNVCTTTLTLTLQQQSDIELHVMESRKDVLRIQASLSEEIAHRVRAEKELANVRMLFERKCREMQQQQRGFDAERKELRKVYIYIYTVYGVIHFCLFNLNSISFYFISFQPFHLFFDLYYFAVRCMLSICMLCICIYISQALDSEMRRALLIDEERREAYALLTMQDAAANMRLKAWRNKTTNKNKKSGTKSKGAGNVALATKHQPEQRAL
jgi:hypothetical protein